MPSLPEPKLNKGTALLRDLVELYIPGLCFVLMFLAFICQIFCRYVLRSPVPWAYEITVACYLWMVVLGACYAQRERSHVTFTLVYDRLQPGRRPWFPSSWKTSDAHRLRLCLCAQR